ncbi:ATPase domain-containing protein [Haloarcula amylovorans]|uniref:ATPase domain-containing protein n=1 Tax=Haloarcula amylovorans TaxID=2562280 RepID=UPI001076A4CF|nr:ATPase domain-containing protein [Halomicroarcula amylolytica]
MSSQTPERISTGISGLDEVLHGGLIANRSYLVRGEPGTGKTILGTHFLKAGADQGETVLYVNLEETTEDIKTNAATLGIDLDDVEFLDLSPDSEMFARNQSYDIFAPSEVEQSSLTDAVTERVEDVEPDRVFIDPITRLRYLTPDDHQFRQQVISFMQYLREAGATVVFTSQNTKSIPDDDLQFMSDGTIKIELGEFGRTVVVPKFRGSQIRGGTHAMRIRDDDVSVFPELQPSSYDREFVAESIPSGVPEMDELLHGGIERGTITVISGPTGVGKTTTGTQFMKEAAGRGERSVVYMFEETKGTFLQRSESINMPVREMLEQDSLNVHEIEALNFSPEEFAHLVREDVEEHDTRIVMIDGIDGYRLSLRGEETNLVRKLHTLCRYLKNMGVTVILVEETEAVTGRFTATEAGISYLADNIIFLQHLELEGRMRKAIGVLKKRTSDFERTLREFRITENGIEVGESLTDLRGILSDTPTTRVPAEERED